MTAAALLRAAVGALLDVVGHDYGPALAPALDGDPDAVAVLVAFMRAVNHIAAGAADTEVHTTLRQLLAALAALRRRSDAGTRLPR
ncbi:MAG: hypothetical protein IT293_11315 [Deltaproteobacteria bacterium]|nr:hypothetical protein [Deltaproteobacteria bacterium]